MRLCHEANKTAKQMRRVLETLFSKKRRNKETKSDVSGTPSERTGGISRAHDSQKNGGGAGRVKMKS